MTGRRRFNCISNAQELVLGDSTYQQILQQYRGRVLPDSHPDAVFVSRVLSKLLSPSQLQDAQMEKMQWKVHVIRDEQKNAFVLPGYVLFSASNSVQISNSQFA